MYKIYMDFRYSLNYKHICLVSNKCSERLDHNLDYKSVASVKEERKEYQDFQQRMANICID